MLQHSLPWIVGVLVTIAEMSTDLFVPGLPKISQQFSASEQTVGLVLSLNLMGLAVSGLVYGPLSDHYGRRKIMLTGCVIFTLGSLLCCFSQTLEQLIFFRCLQGVGGGSAVVVGLSSIRDRYQGVDSARQISIIEMLIALSPGMGPIIGSFIIVSFTWRAVFWFISVCAVIGLLIAWFLYPETKTPTGIRNFSWRDVFHGYLRLLQNGKFLGYSFVQVLFFSWLVSENAILPFVFVNTYKTSINFFGLLMFIHFSAYIIGTLINQSIVHYIGVSRALFIGIWISLVGSIALFVVPIYWEVSALGVALLLTVPTLGAAFVICNSTSKALGYVGHDTGKGAALLSFWQLSMSAFFVFLLGYYFDGTIRPLAILILTCSILSTLGYLFVKKRLSQHRRPVIG